MSSDITTRALDRIERNQRLFRLTMVGALMLEATLIAALVLLVDFTDRTQALVFVSSIGGYTLMTLGFVMLAVYLERMLLRAVQLAGR